MPINQQTNLQEPSEADVPAGAEASIRGAARILPDSLKIRQELDKGRVLFTSTFSEFQLPMRTTRVKVVDGQREIIDPGHVIKFDRGLFWADAETRHKHHRLGEVTEPVFLRDYISRNANCGVTEVTEKMAATSTEQKSDMSMTIVELLDKFEPSVLRERLFSSEEVMAHNLGKATKDTLIITAIRLNKQIPVDLLGEAQMQSETSTG